MRFVPHLNVRNRLTLTFLFVILLSWFLNAMAFRYVFDWELQRVRQEDAQAGRVEAPPPPGAPQRPRGRLRARVETKAVPIQAAIAVIMSLVAGAWLSRRFTRPLTLLEEGAHAFHERKFQYRIPQQGNDEFARVAGSMNEMAEHVEAQIGELEADALRRQQLLVDVAHELRSPVATLKTMAEALRDGVASQPERKERALHSMIEMADRMQRLVTDMMELAKLDLRELPLHLQRVDLVTVAEESVMLHLDAAAHANVKLKPVRFEGRTFVQGDPTRLSQIIDNLVDNAIDYAGEGSEVEIAVSNGKGAKVAVRDNGRGISEDALPYIFDAFFRVDSARTPKGHHSGLGLRIARGLAEAHGGTLDIESEKDHGTCAVFTMPAA